jgi:hypothetical protein
MVERVSGCDKRAVPTTLETFYSSMHVSYYPPTLVFRRELARNYWTEWTAPTYLALALRNSAGDLNLIADSPHDSLFSTPSSLLAAIWPLAMALMAVCATLLIFHPRHQLGLFSHALLVPVFDTNFRLPGPSRCFTFWQELLGCYVVNAGDGEVGKKKCIPALEDYYECLHHSKEVCNVPLSFEYFPLAQLLVVPCQMQDLL